MQWKIPKNTDKYRWTEHVAFKMRQYGLSEQKIRSVIRSPKRLETGIIPDTVAVMQPAGTIKKGLPAKKSAFGNASGKQLSAEGETWNQEIWVLYQIKTDSGSSVAGKKRSAGKDGGKPVRGKIEELRKKFSQDTQMTIISAWRYPGMAPQRDPIPAEILRELEERNIMI